MGFLPGEISNNKPVNFYQALEILMFQNPRPISETIRKFVEICATKLGWQKNNEGPAIIWEGQGINEVGRREDTGEIVIKIDSRYYRPTEVHQLLGDPTKAKNSLGWQPKISLEEMIKEMIIHDKKLALRESSFK